MTSRARSWFSGVNSKGIEGLLSLVLRWTARTCDERAKEGRAAAASDFRRKLYLRDIVYMLRVDGRLCVVMVDKCLWR